MTFSSSCDLDSTASAAAAAPAAAAAASASSRFFFSHSSRRAGCTPGLFKLGHITTAVGAEALAFERTSGTLAGSTQAAPAAAFDRTGAGGGATFEVALAGISDELELELEEDDDDEAATAAHLELALAGISNATVAAVPSASDAETSLLPAAGVDSPDSSFFVVRLL